MPPNEQSWFRDALPRGSVINGFRITGILGRGGFGITYEAVDHIGQRFAIKECFPRQFASREGSDVVAHSRDDEDIFSDCRDRFLREARALVDLGKIEKASEGIVKVVTFFEANGTGYLVMELLSGRTLGDLIAEAPDGVPAERIATLMRGVLHALGAVHDAGLLHRDIKPANIALRDDGRPVLIDFGAVRATSRSQTTLYTRVSTPGYTPIEQFYGLEQGRMSDIYAFAATFYRAIGGTPQDAEQRERALRRGNPDPQRKAAEVGAGRYPAGLLFALDEALKVEPDERPQSVSELLALIEQSTPTVQATPAADKEEPKPAPPDARPTAVPIVPPPAPAKSRAGIFAAIVAAGLAAIVIFAAAQNGWVHLGSPAPPSTTPSPSNPPSTGVAPPPAPPAQPPAPPAGPSAAQVEKEQQAYNLARGNASALRSYLNACQVCAMKAAAQAEFAQLDRADQEDRMYQAARGNSSSLRNYVNTCQICTSKLAAQAEIQQLDRTEQERQMYQNARGDVAALQRYLNACQVCAYSSPARDEIQQKSNQCANASAEDIVRPIRLVYQAINSRNLDLYAAQWDDTATSHDAFVNETHTKAEKVDNKRKQFNMWETVDLRMQAISLLSHSGNMATAQVTYSMTFKYAGQAPRSRSDIIEKYDLVCDASGTWLIKYNLDEINVTQ